MFIIEEWSVKYHKCGRYLFISERSESMSKEWDGIRFLLAVKKWRVADYSLNSWTIGIFY